MPEPTAQHWALAAEAVTSGPMLERDITARVASMLAHVDAMAVDAERAAVARRDRAAFEAAAPATVGERTGP